MLENLTKEDLPESLWDIVDIIGVDSIKELIKLTGGGSIYIPSENSISKSIRNKMIKESFKGNYREISRKFGISEVQVRNIISG